MQNMLTVLCFTAASIILTATLQLLKKAADRYRKKYELKKMTSTQGRMTGTPSPRSKTTHLLRHWRQSKEKNNVARTLNFHYSILSDFKQMYKVSNEHDKNAAAHFVCGKVIHKYKLVKMAQNQLAINTKG